MLGFGVGHTYDKQGVPSRDLSVSQYSDGLFVGGTGYKLGLGLRDGAGVLNTE